MYKILGTDGKEYGPMAIDTLHEWIAQGRVMAQTPVKLQWSDEWRSLVGLPEFSGLFEGRPSQDSALAVVSFGEGLVSPRELTSQVLSRDYSLYLVSCFVSVTGGTSSRPLKNEWFCGLISLRIAPKRVKRLAAALFFASHSGKPLRFYRFHCL
jgi:GYF domain 2